MTHFNIKRVITIYFYLFIIMIPLIGNSQSSSSSDMIETIIESIVETLGEEADVMLIVEDLSDLAENPVDINNTTTEELSRIHLLDDIQIQKLQQYLHSYGPAYSIYELNSIDGFTPDLLRQIEPFIRFGEIEAEVQSLSSTISKGRHELLLRALGTAQKADGYRERDDGTTPFEGNRARYYTRYLFKSGEKLSIGFTGEKDPGESFFSGSNRAGFDFNSAHLNFQIDKTVEKIVIGDYVVLSGQGLVLWQGFSTGKSLNIMNIFKTNQGVRPYTSSDENQFFRGIGLQLRHNDLRLNLFFSKKRRDANIVDNALIGPCFTSLQSSGYHRTKSEIEDRRSISDMNAGAVTTWSFNNLKLGATFIFRKFPIPFIPADQLYNQFRFHGTTNMTGGCDYLYSKGRYRLFGEAGLSRSGGKAFLQGLTTNLHDQLQFSALFRHYEKEYQALWASAFSEGSSPSNETGLYLGIRILPVQKVTITAYSDFFRSQWIQFNTAGPSAGYDCLVQADFQMSKKFKFHIRTKIKESEQKIKNDGRYQNETFKTQKSRLHLEFQPKKQIIFKTRIENNYSILPNHDPGWLFYQDIQFRPKRVPLNIDTRVALFHTESYNSRIYAYENDLLYTYSTSAYYGKGLRSYLNLKYKINSNWEVWFKLSNTWQSGAESSGSGYLEIPGAHKTDLKFQLRLKI